MRPIILRSAFLHPILLVSHALPLQSHCSYNIDYINISSGRPSSDYTTPSNYYNITPRHDRRMYGACIVWYEQLPQDVAALFIDGTLENTVSQD